MARDERHDEPGVAEHLDHRTEELKCDVVRKGNKAWDAILRIHDHSTVPTNDLCQAPLPAIPLSGELTNALGSFRPGNRIRNEFDPVRSSEIAAVPVEPNDEFHVLTNGAGVETAGVGNHGTPEGTERSRDDERGANRVPSHPRREERPQILENLESNQDRFRESDIVNCSSVNGASVGDPHDAPDSNRRRIFQERTHDTSEGIRLQDRVGIHGAKERTSRVVQADIESVGLSAVRLVDNNQVSMLDTLIDRVHRSRRKVAGGHPHNWFQVERIAKHG